MTICIAAACNVYPASEETKIILCTDWRVSGQLGSADTMIKQEYLRGSWWCLTAGNTEEINAVLPVLTKSFEEAPEINETNIKPIIEDALRARLAQKRDAIAYARYSMTYASVYDTGKLKLPEAQFVRFISETSLVKLDAQFIIAGFYNNDYFILRTSDAGEVSNPTFFACVGEGSYLARASLMQRGYTDVKTLGEALYLVYEAKKAAEAVNSVGESTLISVLSADGSRKRFKETQARAHFEELYRKYGPQAVPRAIDVPQDLFA